MSVVKALCLTLIISWVDAHAVRPTRRYNHQSSSPQVHNRPSLPSYPSPIKETKTAPARTPAQEKADNDEIIRVVGEIVKDPEYLSWIEKGFDPSRPLTKDRLEAAFQDGSLSEILNRFTFRPELSHRVTKALKQGVLLSQIPLIDLNDMLKVEFFHNEVRLTPLDTPRAKTARARWKSEPLANQVNLLLQAGADYNLIFQTPWGKQIAKGIDAIVAAAISEPVGNLGGRQLTFKDPSGNITALAVHLSGKHQNIAQTRGILSAFYADPENRSSLALTAPEPNGRPTHTYYSWAKDQQKYVLMNNKDAVDKFDADIIANGIVQDPEVKKVMLKQYLDWRNSPTGAWNADAILNNDHLYITLEASVADRPELKSYVTAAVNQKTREMARGLMNHRDPNYVKVTGYALTPGHSVIPKKDPNTPRIALIINGSVGKLHENTVKNLGGEAIYVSGAADAEQKIKEAYARYGQKLDVIFSSHGNQSFMIHLLALNDPATQSLLRNTEGMMKRVYMAGCYCGGGTQQIPDHLLKQFVARGADSATGVTPQLYANNYHFYVVDHGGQIVHATSQHQKLYNDLAGITPPGEPKEGSYAVKPTRRVRPGGI